MACRQTNQRSKQTLILPANRPYTQSVTEKLPYTAVSSGNGFEIRHYPAYVLVQVKEGGDFETAGSRGFRPLFNYIAGFNASGEKIAMTAPVLQAQKDEGFITSFVMPASMSMSQMPSSSVWRGQIVLQLIM